MRERRLRCVWRLALLLHQFFHRFCVLSLCTLVNVRTHVAHRARVQHGHLGGQCVSFLESNSGVNKTRIAPRRNLRQQGVACRILQDATRELHMQWLVLGAHCALSAFLVRRHRVHQRCLPCAIESAPGGLTTRTRARRNDFDITQHDLADSNVAASKHAATTADPWHIAHLNRVPHIHLSNVRYDLLHCWQSREKRVLTLCTSSSATSSSSSGNSSYSAASTAMPARSDIPAPVLPRTPAPRQST